MNKYKLVIVLDGFESISIDEGSFKKGIVITHEFEAKDTESALVAAKSKVDEAYLTHVYGWDPDRKYETNPVKVNLYELKPLWIAKYEGILKPKSDKPVPIFEKELF